MRWMKMRGLVCISKTKPVVFTCAGSEGLRRNLGLWRVQSQHNINIAADAYLDR
jgi:hypothetical protein